jgi:hypothetical protein
MMHALVLEQSGGEMVAMRARGGLDSHAANDARRIREARSVQPADGRIHVGLTRLSTDPRSVTAAMFAPCLNVTLAARQLTKLAERCHTREPIYCAIAAYHGSWDRPDTRFADAVRATAAKGNAPNFEMPKDAYFDADDIAFDASPSSWQDARTAPALTPDDRQRGWSSPLFPAKPTTSDNGFTDVKKVDRAAEEPPSQRAESTVPATGKSSANSLFVPRSSEQRP